MELLKLHYCPPISLIFHPWTFKHSKDYSRWDYNKHALFSICSKSWRGGGDLGVWLFYKIWTVCLDCTWMVINASHCQPYHTAWKPCHTSLTPVSVPAFVFMHRHTHALDSDAPLHTLKWRKHKKFSVFIHRCTHDRTQLTILFLVFGIHGSHMATKWVWESAFSSISIFLCLYTSEKAKWDYCNPAWPGRRGNPNAVYFIPC